MVILKVVRGERDDPTALQIARLTVADLAGSERTKHTQTTGDRLKEAGNINKSLMVLGQCMEALRSNQRKVAASLSQEGADGRVDTHEFKCGLAVVPFRHSKLTEALMDYFVDDARAVMIVDVNPYNTGYDENSHVMKFAALAREVYVTPAPVSVQRLPTAGKTLGLGKCLPTDAAPKPNTREVTISMGGPGSGSKANEAVLEVLEEDEGDGADSDDDEPINPLVDALFDKVEELRMQLFESEMRCAIIEVEVCEEVMREMELRMASMEKMYARRLMNKVQANEMKTDAKIDMLHQLGLFGSPMKRRQPESDISEEEDVETSLTKDHGASDFTSEDESERGRSESPLAGKSGREERAFIPDPPMLASDTEEAELRDSEAHSDLFSEDEGEDGMGDSGAETGSIGDAASATTGSEDGSDADYTEDEEEEEAELRLSAAKTPRAKPVVAQRADSPTPVQRLQAPTPRVSKLQRGMQDLALGEGEGEAAVKFRARQESSEHEDGEPGARVPAQKKKKKILAKKTVATEEEIERAAAREDRGKNVRRMTGRF
ncbi:hypothetical protein K438DRAFT_1815163 [Mycena galopus ATCC 62051]|nr:hypothetical protein K438DRAFT_1815163 [Mycena galopus ATCC 62051]